MSKEIKMYDDDEIRDEGFNLPDTRYVFYSNGKSVKVEIVRHWFTDDDDNTDFKVSFNIVSDDMTTNLPIGTHVEDAIEIAEKLYPQTEEDIEAARSDRETEMIYAAERRMGA